MRTGINLFKQKTQDASKRDAIEKTKQSIIKGLVLYIFIIGIIFGISLLIQNKDKSAQAEILKTQGEIKKYQKVESLALSLKDRIKTIDALMKNRENIDITLSNVRALFPEKVSLDLISISGIKLDLQGKASSSADLQSFLSSANSSQTIFSNLSIGPLSRLSNGQYSFYIQGNLNKI